MENIKLTVSVIAKMKGMTLKELAEATGIPYNHLRLVSCGKVEMLAKDFWAIQKFANLPPETIQY